MKNILSKSLAVVATLGLIGCGGGGSSSGDSGLNFPSTATKAEPTIQNGQKVKEIVAKDQQLNYMMNAVEASESQNIVFTLLTLQDTLRSKQNLDTYALNETINESEDCLNGGTIHYSGSGSDPQGGTITTTFNQCNMNGMIINGSVYEKIYTYNSEHNEYQNSDIKYLTDTSIKIGEIYSKIYANSTASAEVLSFNSYDEIDSIKLSINTISEVNSVKSGQNNAIYYLKNLHTSTPSMYQTQGKIYIDNLASFVDYDTSYDMSKTPFVLNDDSLSSGEACYNMANGGKVKIVVESNRAKTYVDANGDGAYELSETY
ncbi:MAG: hypothetical protein KU29_12530 [Sulfurovum sp. FS06-10]|jgi:hypothetical protein|nr:MAG: hypothetical protein KU29_13050 [Sulfurovum sp. FS06-10]KIM03195.1 MAG: hypothetical protein KU29_12530 [Sulfurovum sp. FS06-10]